MLSDDDEICEDSWLKLNELYNINALIDEFLDKILKLATVKNRKADKNINIDKYLEIDKYVDEYTVITDGKIDLFNNLDLILSKARVEIQNEAYIINDLKGKENCDIKTLETMHETLEKVLILWTKTISSTFKNDKFSEYDMKPARPSNEKPARKSNRKDKKSKKTYIYKDIKPYIDKDIKPYIKKDTKPDIKKDTKPDIKKDSKPNIKIDKKTSLEVLKVVKFKFKNKSYWKKKVITWVFWKSHVTELCEKWICCRNNYAYTRFEEFRTCSGKVLFTNEHKAVFSKNKAKTYIDINDLEIFIE